MIRLFAASAGPSMQDRDAQTEALIRESGVPALIFRNALYLDTPPVSLGGPAVFTAGIRVPAGQGAVAYALRREMRGAEDGRLELEVAGFQTCE